MRRDHGVLKLFLVIVLVFSMALMTGFALAPAWAQEEEEEDIQPKGMELRPNPMERSVDPSKSTIILKKGSTMRDPSEKGGISKPAMRPGTTSRTGSVSSKPGMPGAKPGGSAGWDPFDNVALKDGRNGMMQKGAAGKMQFFLLQGSSQVLAPDGNYQLSNGRSITVSGGQASMPVDPYDLGGATQSGNPETPGQMNMPGKMR